MDKGFPVSPERAIFLADAHLNQDDEHARSFLLLAEQALRENAALFLLGDIFDLWFGVPDLLFSFQKPAIARLRELHREGLRLYYVEGNRDFYLKKHYEGTLFDAVAESDMQAAVGNRRIYLSHGDTVNRADLAYRFWKAISKNRVSFGAFAALPAPLTLPLAERMERRLRPTNPRFKGSFPEGECREFARRRFAAGDDVVVLGHFHTERMIRFGEGPDAKLLAVLPSWKEAWRYLYVASSGDSGMRAFSPGKPLVP